MTNTQSILIGSALIAFSVIVAGGIRPAQADRNGPYQLMHHSNTVGNAGVFRLDTASGDVSYCYIAGDQSLACTKEVK